MCVCVCVCLCIIIDDILRLDRPQCFSLTDTVRFVNGTDIPIEQLHIGDQVLALDVDDRIVSTDIIAFLHYENQSQGKLKINKTHVSV
jgi:hypothetical protein